MTPIDLDKLREELDDFAEPEKKGGCSAREERIVGGFDRRGASAVAAGTLIELGQALALGFATLKWS